MILFGYQKRKKKGDMATPQPTFPDNLAGFGYEFKDGKLKNIQTGEPFVFAVSPDDRDYNQKRYEALGELVQQDVYQLVKRECGMIKASVPINSRPGDPQTFVFLSSDFMTNDDKILIVIQGSGAVRAGQWSRKLTINESIESGTQIPYIQIARREGYAVVVMNPNDNSRIVENQKQMIKGSESAVAHASYVWETYLQESKAKHIAIVGHSYGGEVTKSLFDKYKEDFKQRVFAVALTSSTHSFADHTEYSDLIKISRHWQTSDQPLDTELPTMENGMKMVSAVSFKRMTVYILKGRPRVKFLLWVVAICLLTLNLLQSTRDPSPASAPWLELDATPTDWPETASTDEEDFDPSGNRSPYAEGSLYTPFDGDRCDCLFLRHDQHVYPSKEYDVEIPWLNKTTVQLLEETHPNLPASFLHQRGREGGCMAVPTHFEIKWHNDVWQEAARGGDGGQDEKIFVYSAFYDARANTERGPCVRILGVSQLLDPEPLWCTLWFDPSKPPVSAHATAEHLDIQDQDPRRQMPYLFTCDLPASVEHLVPAAVSLVSVPCGPTANILKVVGGRERGSSAVVGESDGKNTPVWNVAVCGPALYYYHWDAADRLIEWVEALRAMGVAKVFLYETDVPPRMIRVLRHYEKGDFVQVLPFTYPPPYSNHPAMRRAWASSETKKMYALENIYFSDCVLRHMHEYRFIAHFDTDEMPILLRHETLPQLVGDLLRSYPGLVVPAFALQSNLFYDDLPPTEEAQDIPTTLWVLRHTLRFKKDEPQDTRNTKPIFDMDVTRGAFSHAQVTCVDVIGLCPYHYQVVNSTTAYVGHFRKSCKEKCQDKNLLRTETAHLRHKDTIIRAVTSVREKLHMN